MITAAARKKIPASREKAPLPRNGAGRLCRHARLLCLGLLTIYAATAQEGPRRRMTALDAARDIIAAVPPLQHPLGKRLPLIIWRLQNLSAESPAELEEVLRGLQARGIAPVTGWNDARRDTQLPGALEIAALQQRLGMPVVINSTGVMNRFFNGDERSAHIDASGKPFFDLSHSSRVKIGCPFAVGYRYAAIRNQVEAFVRAYKEQDLPLDIVIADWEIDGPIEWNGAWEHAKRCTRCRENIPDIADFHRFQAAYRHIRNDMQKRCYAEVIHQYYPKALVGNYAEYPHDGKRYWYDYFELPPTDQPHTLDQREPVRPWHQGFADTGYTFAMPVVYTWYRIFDWYDYANPDYRWVYSMLKVASNAGRSAPPDLPIITFVHWHTTAPPADAADHVQQLSADTYQDLLWHMLLRGHDGLAMWCREEETLSETTLVHRVFADSLAFSEFLEQGTPLSFAVPPREGPVVSALRLRNRLLVRRSDFAPTEQPVTLTVDGKPVPIPPAPGRTVVIELPQ